METEYLVNILKLMEVDKNNFYNQHFDDYDTYYSLRFKTKYNKEKNN